jgi:membrane-bound lytic murein transglycosylase B
MASADARANARLDNIEMGKLALTETVGSLRARGLKFETTLPADAPAMLVALRVANGTEYRVGFTNFYAITRYNRSHLYASAVSDLADAIGAARNRPPDAARPATAPAPTRPPMTPPATNPAGTGWSAPANRS